MVDTEEKNLPSQDDEEQEFGWKFHKGPLIAALVLTAIFYLIVFILSSIDV